jgi:hypothetical protein
MLTFWRNALNPKSETFKFPKASRRRFSGYTEKKRKKKGDLIRAGPIRKSTSQMLNYTICWLFTFRSLWYTPFRWQWATASISCWKYRLDSFSESLPWWTCKSVHPHQEATQKSFTSIFAKLTTSINNSFT